MIISDFLNLDRIACQETLSSKKRALEKISTYLVDNQPVVVDAAAIFNKLMERERLGSTGLGSGVAIPHCRLSDIDNISIALMTLSEGIDFDAQDNQPVDILFALVVPEHCTETHLQVLAVAAEMFSDKSFCTQLRQSQSSADLLDCFVDFNKATSNT